MFVNISYFREVFTGDFLKSQYEKQEGMNDDRFISNIHNTMFQFLLGTKKTGGTGQ